MDFETQKHYYNRCSPSEFLEAGDSRYVAIDELGDEDHRVRGEDWSGKLVRHIKLSKNPVCELLTGLPGSGKSTELRRVAQQLTTGKYLPVVIDAEDVIDLNSSIDVPDIIIAVLYQVERRVLQAEGKNPDKAGEESFFDRVKGGFSVELKGTAEVAIPFVKLAAEMKYNASLRERVRKAVARHVKAFLAEAHADLLTMNARATKVQGYESGIVVLFDSMEKLRGITSNHDAVLQSAEQIFQGGAPYLQLPVHVLYTVPAALISRRRFEAIEIMPMIKLRTKEEQEFPAGFEAAKRIVVRRVPPDVLKELLGEETMDLRVKELIAWSGGYPRELIRLLQRVVGSERFPLSDRAFTRVLNEVGDQYSAMIFASAYPWLAQIAVDKPAGLTDDDNHRDTADQMLSSNAILRYLNDSAWFDLHPAVRAIPGVQAEIAKLQRERASAAQ